MYVTFGAHGTACLDTKTAEVIWQRQDDELYCDHFRLPASSPILHKGLLYLIYDGADRQFVVALNKADGKTKWLHKRAFEFGTNNGDRKKAYGTPAIIKVGVRNNSLRRPPWPPRRLIRPPANCSGLLEPAA